MESSRTKCIWNYPEPQAHQVQFSSVAQSCLTLCDPMNRSIPGLPVHHQLPESTQTHVHWVGDAIQPSHPLSSPSPPALNLSQHQGLFKNPLRGSLLFKSVTESSSTQHLSGATSSADSQIEITSLNFRNKENRKEKLTLHHKPVIYKCPILKELILLTGSLTHSFVHCAFIKHERSLLCQGYVGIPRWIQGYVWVHSTISAARDKG